MIVVLKCGWKGKGKRKEKKNEREKEEKKEKNMRYVERNKMTRALPKLESARLRR